MVKRTKVRNGGLCIRMRDVQMGFPVTRGSSVFSDFGQKVQSVALGIFKIIAVRVGLRRTQSVHGISEDDKRRHCASTACSVLIVTSKLFNEFH
jgi:hypothetical protein